jgi:periplasmic glucans biosynthesis protein
MKVEPKQLAGAPRCGARTKTRGGRPCRSPAVGGKKRCRLHGGSRGSGGQPGAANGRFRHGKYSAQAKELGRLMRELAKTGEALLARTLDTHGLGRKLPAALRRRTHIKKARAAAAAAKKAQPKGEKA